MNVSLFTFLKGVQTFPHNIPWGTRIFNAIPEIELQKNAFKIQFPLSKKNLIPSEILAHYKSRRSVRFHFLSKKLQCWKERFLLRGNFEFEKYKQLKSRTLLTLCKIMGQNTIFYVIFVTFQKLLKRYRTKQGIPIYFN